MTNRTTHTQQTGFTLPELLVVGVVILVFVGVMLALVRPANYDASRRNAARRLDLAALMRAITDYKKAEGHFPPSIAANQETAIASSDDGSPSLCDNLVPAYLADLPYDPKDGTRLAEALCSAPGQYFVTGYTVQLAAGRLTLRAPSAEKRESITVERAFPLF